MQSAQSPMRVRGVVARDVDSETVLLAPDGGEMLVLNPTGAAVWDLCDGRHSVPEMAAFICEHAAGGELPRVTQDIAALVGQLQQAGFVTASRSCTDSDREGTGKV